jgi:predicted RNase H-like nuclease (RuvC/YqgF family)
MNGEILATIIVALIALFGTIVTAVLQYRATEEAKKAKHYDEEKQRADAAERKLEKEQRDREHEQIKAEMESLHKEIAKVHEDVQHLGDRIDAVKKTTDAHLSSHDDTLAKISDILSRDARTYSGLMKMHSQTESRLQALLNIQICSMQFANDTAATLHVVGDILGHTLEDEEAQGKLSEAVSKHEGAQNNFIKELMNQQQSLFNSNMMDNASESAEERSDDVKNRLSNR